MNDQELKDAISDMQECRELIGKANMRLNNILTQRKADMQKKLDDAYQKGLDDGKKAFDLLDAERDSEYQRGLNDAWEAARKIVTWPDRSLVNSNTFDLDPGENIFVKYSASEAIAKLKAFEDKQKEDDSIKVGDEVIWSDSTTLIVTAVYVDGGFEWCDGISQDGRMYHVLLENVRKTGRHFDIESILKGMQS